MIREVSETSGLDPTSQNSNPLQTSENEGDQISGKSATSTSEGNQGSLVDVSKSASSANHLNKPERAESRLSEDDPIERWDEFLLASFGKK